MEHRSDLTNMAEPKTGSGMQQGREERSEQSDPEESMPIKDLQSRKKGCPQGRKEMFFKGRISDLTSAEKTRMQQMRQTRGHAQWADFVMPNTTHIVRCSVKGCSAPINTHGIERAIKSHLRTARPEIRAPVKAAVLKFHHPYPEIYFYPAPMNRRAGGKKETQKAASECQPWSASPDTHQECPKSADSEQTDEEDEGRNRSMKGSQGSPADVDMEVEPQYSPELE